MKFAKSDIIIRRSLRYPNGALEVDGYNEEGKLLAHPIGGGFQYAIALENQADLRKVLQTEIDAVPIRAGQFELGSLPGKYAGYTRGDAWNGWATPSFPFTEAQRLVFALTADSETTGRYDAAGDAFVTKMSHADEEEDVWSAEEVVLPTGEKVKVYPIGSRSWCWDEVSEAAVIS
jgi:hypothetical protein